VQRADFERARRDAATFGGAPVLVGEWGSGPERAEDPADVYFRSHQALQDEFQFSATLWTWRESCGDPHKAGDARAGRVPQVWGEFEVDCRTNTVVARREALIAQLSRAYARAAPGRLFLSVYEPGSDRFAAAGHNAPKGGRAQVWYPAPLGRSATIASVGLRDIRVWPRHGGAVVSARTTDDEWLLGVAP
jgi:endoglycosylceramidase